MKAMTPRSWAFTAFCAAGIWLILGFSYLTRTRDFVRSHDFKDHLTYTMTLVEQHRLPTIEETYEWTSPPLYYLLAGTLAPHVRTHPMWVRLFSLLLGTVGVLIILRVLYRLNVTPLAALGTTLWVTSIPQYVFVFSTYSNDSLSTLLAMAVIGLSIEWWMAGKTFLWVALLVTVLAGVYSKATVVNLLLILSVGVAVAGYSRRLSWPAVGKLLIAYGAGLVAYLPWLVHYLHRSDKKIFTFIYKAVETGLEGMRLPHSVWATLVMPPGLTPGEWSTPFAGIWSMTATKKGSLLAYLFTTSIYGEYEYVRPALPFIWSLVLLHAGLMILALTRWRRTDATKAAVLTIALATASYAIFVVPSNLGTCMDFRFITWTWIAWAVLWAELWKERSFVGPLFVGGFLLHGYFLLTAQSTW